MLVLTTICEVLSLVLMCDCYAYHFWHDLVLMYHLGADDSFMRGLWDLTKIVTALFHGKGRDGQS